MISNHWRGIEVTHRVLVFGFFRWKGKHPPVHSDGTLRLSGLGPQAVPCSHPPIGRGPSEVQRTPGGGNAETRRASHCFLVGQQTATNTGFDTDCLFKRSSSGFTELSKYTLAGTNKLVYHFEGTQPETLREIKPFTKLIEYCVSEAPSARQCDFLSSILQLAWEHILTAFGGAMAIVASIVWSTGILTIIDYDIGLNTRPA